MAELRAPSLARALRDSAARLAKAGVREASLDARLIVEHVSGTTRRDAIADPSRILDSAMIAALEAALVRREASEPVHRILGYREFFGLKLELSRETLEPRPDTECLVEAALPFVNACVASKGGCSILDLGTGTGAVALALLNEVAGARATGTDISEEALQTALRNASALGLRGRFEAVHSEWFQEISGCYDVIVSNPPYIPSKAIEGLAPEVRVFDPRPALDGGVDGLDAYRAIAEGVAMHLRPGGCICVEIGFDQKLQVSDVFQRAGFLLSGAKTDLSGNDRVLMFRSGGER